MRKAKIEIGLVDRCGARWWIVADPLRAQQLDLGPDPRPHREEQRQGRETEQIAATPLAVEIGVEHGVRVARKSALAEIHQQKGEVVEDIDGGKIVVELDRIEQDRPAVDLDDVAQMQIAVAVAHITSGRPRSEQRRQRGEHRFARLREGRYRLGRKGVGAGGEFLRGVAKNCGKRSRGMGRREQPVGGRVEIDDGLS